MQQVFRKVDIFLSANQIDEKAIDECRHTARTTLSINSPASLLSKVDAVDSV